MGGNGRKARVFLSVIVAIAVAGGCVRNHYVVEITPDGESFQRTLTAWQQRSHDDSETSDALPDREVQRLKPLYQEHTFDAKKNRHIFSGRFRGKTPDDVGGAGSLTTFTSKLGTLSVYVERFRGDDRLNAELAKRRAAADQLVDLLIGWFRSEIEDRQQFDDVRKFLDEQLRADLKNLGVYGWTLGAVSDYEDNATEEFVVRAFQYLVERGYVTPSDLPSLYRALSDEDARRLLALLQRVLARQIGVRDQEPIPESLGFLHDPEHAGKAFSKYLRGTEFYQQRLAAWRAEREERGDTEDESPPSPLDMFLALLAEAVFEFQFASSDVVEVHLHTKVEPFATNGDWDAETKAVSWSQSLDKQRALPMLVYAAWSEPDGDAQQRRFGQVVLEGEALAKYVTWYRGLEAGEASEWNAFLESLQGGPQVNERVAEFRFTTDPERAADAEDEERAPSLADTPRKLILEGLKRESP